MLEICIAVGKGADVMVGGRQRGRAGTRRVASATRFSVVVPVMVTYITWDFIPIKSGLSQF